MSSTASFVLPVDKPAGPTSHDVVASARRALRTRRIGHTGTLDPFASGLMLLCVNGATRIAEYLSDLPKTYHARARFDGRTPTDDDTADVTDSSDAWKRTSIEDVRAAFEAQVGAILQMPPQFSAKKIAGERAYDIARRGDVAALTSVRVQIYRITLRNIEMPDVSFEVECASGTYIRSIARDVGNLLGTGGYLTELRRTRVGEHEVEAAVPMADLADEARVQVASLTPLHALRQMEAVTLNDAEAKAIRFGQMIEKPVDTSGPVLLVREAQLVAIALPKEGWLKPHKVFADA